MVELDNFDKDFVSKLRELSKDVILNVRDAHDDEIPVKSIYVAEDEKVVEKDIKWPGELIDQYRSETSEVLHETAEWMEAYPDKSYRWEEVLDPFRSESQPVGNDFIRDPSHRQLVGAFESDLSEFAADVLNYCGKVVYDEDAFTKASERFLADMSFIGPLGDIPQEYSVVFPLLNYVQKRGPLELDADIRIIDRYDGEWISHIELSELTAEELASIYTWEGSREFKNTGSAFNKSSHGIKIKMNGSPHASHDDQVRAAVIAGLRLFKQEAPEVHGGPGYRMIPGAVSHRESILDVCASLGPMSTRTGARSRKRYEINEDEKGEFSEFWKRYKNKLNTESDDNISKSIRRFNEMYRKANIEDQVVDCAIALEGTLLQDINPGSSITFRMMLRSSLLLDNHLNINRQTIRKLFKSIYLARGEIVHNNMQLREIINSNDEFEFEMFDSGKPEAEEFVLVARTLLAQVLLSYIRKESDEGKSVAEVNQEIDAAAFNANYP